MHTFLSRIAAAYTKNVSAEDMSDMCFVFPNKRSGTFFRKALEDAYNSNTPRIEPQITTISDFVAELSDKVKAGRFELLFTLYGEYCRLSGEVDDFDKFVFWGDMLLADFNDADMYMADTSSLFKNLKDIKEIGTDYLSPEQRDVISRYWNMPIPIADPDQFWNHIRNDGEPRTNRDSFLKLWEILHPLYSAFCKQLDKNGLSFSGRQYREIATRLSPSSENRPYIPYTRVIFIGFNVLSVSEVKIFEGLAASGIADFYWDCDFPDDMGDIMQQATTFIRRYKRSFQSRYNITPAEKPECPDITIVSVPSAVGQVKYTGSLLRKMADDGSIHNPANATDTAVVLPAENMFIDLLHSLPPNLPSVNITMGYPLKLTSVAQLVRSVTAMHLRANKVNGKWCFFYEDVTEVLSSPLLASVLGENCEILRDAIERDRLFSIPTNYIEEKSPALLPVFYPVNDLRDADAVFNYSLSMVDFLHGLLSKKTADNADNTSGNLELGFLAAYRRALETLQSIATKHGVKMHDSTFFQLIERTIASETVNFVGEPLQGLQIMGVLETRALTFNNVIMLSMNERIFPQRHINRSFIPEVLRRSYGMCTSEFQECVFAYHFYRLIAGAKRVTLIYDTRTQGINSGDMSRYLYQLIYKFPVGKLHIEHAYFEMPSQTTTKPLEVKKTSRIMDIINLYKSPNEPKRALSASSINDLVACPLLFYFKHVEKLNVSDDIVEYMDEGLFGTILHEIAEQSYRRFQSGNAPLHVTAQLLDRLISEKLELQKLITGSINKNYNRLPSVNPPGQPYSNPTALVGEARVIGNIMQKFMILLFKEEKKRAPFYFVNAEHKIAHYINISPGLGINLNGSIDRIDRLADGTVAIIDYKTGNDNIAVKQLSHLFDTVSDKDGHEKAILQLFIYCNAYRETTGYNGPIKPCIYKFRALESEGLNDVTIEGMALNNYLDFNNEVTNKLSDILTKLFDSDEPFRAIPHQSHCRYCKYGALCGQEIKKP